MLQTSLVVFPSNRVTALNLHRPEKKKRKKLMKDSLYLAAMLRRFTREKEEMKKRTPNMAHPSLAGAVTNKPHSTNSTNHLLASNTTHPQGNTASSDLSLADLTSDPAVMSLLGSANEKELQDLLGDLDFSLLDTDQQHAMAAARENGILGVGVPAHKAAAAAATAAAGGGGGGGGQGRGLGSSSGLFSPPPLPDGLPAPLIKRIEDLRAVSQLSPVCGWMQLPAKPLYWSYTQMPIGSGSGRSVCCFCLVQQQQQ